LKRLLFPLLSALALPTAVNAENIYLKCTLLEHKNYTEYNFTKYTKKELEDQQYRYRFSFNSKNNIGYRFYRMNFKSNWAIDTLGEIQVQKLDILILNEEYIKASWDQPKYNQVYTFKINRKNGEILRIVVHDNNEYKASLQRGICEKDKKPKTLF
tara:strand:+ start:349 stop:816 length:468 start_codon:yes stop_codon:yes gene_type:complete